MILIDEIGFAPMDATGASSSSARSPPPNERRSLGIGSHWPFECSGKFLTEHSTVVSLLDRLLHHNVLVVTEGNRSA